MGCSNTVSYVYLRKLFEIEVNFRYCASTKKFQDNLLIEE